MYISGVALKMPINIMLQKVFEKFGLNGIWQNVSYLGEKPLNAPCWALVSGQMQGAVAGVQQNEPFESKRCEGSPIAADTSMWVRSKVNENKIKIATLIL